MTEAIKTAIVLGYNCNNNCRFCLSRHKNDSVRPLGTKKVKEEIVLARKRGSDRLDFVGGEPTLRKDLPELVSFAKENGFKSVRITTNGRMFSQKKFAEELVGAGLTMAIFSIHGHTAELHDYLTRVDGSYSQAVQGMKNVRELAEGRPDWEQMATNTVMVRPNLKFLAQIAEHNIALGSKNLEFIFPDPQGNCWDNFEELVPRLPELIEPMRSVIKAGQKHGLHSCLMRYLPLCYMYGYFEYLSEYLAVRRQREQHIGPDIFDLEVEKSRRTIARVKGPQCAGCKRSPACEGVFKEYVLKRGFEELVPMP
ncbi:MAG: radical SAM protein [Candidatus Diapherotrites archaeon]|nr:radical SAM protein [Candidatus Diapherotrites archaeon]